MIVQAVKYLGDEYKGAKDNFERILVGRMLTGQVNGLDKEVSHWFSHVIQHKLDLFPQFLGLELYGIFFKYRVRSLQNSVDDVEVAGLELGHHVVHEIRPLGGEILLT